MSSPAQALFDNLDRFARIQELIDSGEAEGQLLECKAPQSPQVDRGTKAQLSTAVSGFANSGGGVVIWSVSTDNHIHSGLDILTQIQPIGYCTRFAQRIDRLLPQLTRPALGCPPSRVLLAHASDSKGLVVTYIPGTVGDPVQALDDQHFYVRVGAEFLVMPYEVLKRMFMGSSSPHIRPVLDGRLVVREPNGIWRIPIVLENSSSAAAKDVMISLTVLNPDACDKVDSHGLRNVSAVNPGKQMFTQTITGNIYRRLNIVIGSLLVTMKRPKRSKRILSLQVSVYADRMRAQQFVMRVQLAKKGFTVEQRKSDFLY
jgi:hypothetical protein